MSESLPRLAEGMDAPFAVTQDTPLIEMSGLCKVYHTPAGEFTGLRGIDLTISRGEFVAIVGRSGCGKSTLVNMITGLDRPTGGSLTVDGTDILALDESEMSRWRGIHLGVVFQFYQLLPTLTLLQNVMLPMDLCETWPPSERHDRARDLLALVHLGDMAHKRPAAVSGGQQQAAAIARALANDPPLIMADEPTGNLDSNAAQQVCSLFQELVNSGKTIVMVTHDPELALLASRQVELADGQVISDRYA